MAKKYCSNLNLRCRTVRGKMKDSKKINVLQLVSALKIGGLEKLLVDFIKSNEMNSNDVNFTIVVINDQVDDVLKKELLEAKYNVYFLNRKESHRHPKYLFQLINIIKKHKIDVIHSHNSGSKMWSILCKVFNPRLKLVYTIHDSVIIGGLTKINMFLHKKFIDKNIAISNVIYEDCLKNNIEKTVKIYNGVNLGKFKRIEGEKHTSEVFSIINIARITYQKKGQDVLIKALKICKNNGMDFVCNLVGGVYDYDKESLEYLVDLLKELNLENEIKFLGNRDDIVELLAQSDLFVLPSRYEGLPISLLEAMASKLPVIASDISGSNDLIKSGETGLLFESDNYTDLAEKILYLYNNKKEMEVLAQKAYEYVQEFDISVMNKKYSGIYKELAGRKF